MVDKKEQTKLRVKRYRDKQKSVTKEKDVTQECNAETAPASYVQGLNGKTYEVLPERPRYLELSDGQVLDRLNQPIGHTSGDFILRMQACNDSAYNFRSRKCSKR